MKADKKNDMKKILFSIIIILTIHGCSNKGKYAETKGDLIKIENFDPNSKFYIDDLVDTIRYIVLETNNDNIIGTISKMKIRNDTIYISDNKNTGSLFLFNMEGKFLFKIEKLGKGVGEYTSLSDFFLTKESIEIFDNKQGKILKYDYKGDYISEDHIGRIGINGNRLHNGNYIFNTSGIRNEIEAKGNHDIFILDKNGNCKLKALPVDKRLKRQPMVNSKCFSEDQDFVYYIPSLSYQLYSIKNNQIQKSISFDFGKYSINQDVFFSSQDPLNQHGKNCVHRLNSFIFTEEYLIFSFFYKNSSGNALLERKTNKVLRIGIDILNSKSTDFSLSAPITTYNNYFVCAIDALKTSKVISLFNDLAILDHMKNNAIEEIYPTDNPILMLYKINEK